MPSPIGHALGGMAFGWVMAGRSTPSAHAGRQQSASRARVWLERGAGFGILGTLPDIDFLLRTHSAYTHSIGACVLVFLLALLVVGGKPRLALAAAAAFGSHIVLDWLGDDTAPPIGIMALWPFTARFYQSDLHWFMAIRRQGWLDTFWSHNLRAVLWEIVLLGPLAALAWWWRAR